MKSLSRLGARGAFLVLALFIGFNTYITALQNGAIRCFGATCGMFFWGSHKVDGLWHVALIESAFRQWPPLTPIAANLPLRGYNILLDIVGSMISLSGIPPLQVYFVAFPLVWAVAMILVCVWFSQSTQQPKRFLFFFMVLAFFGANANVVFSLYHKHTFFDFQSFGAALNLVNMQYAFSLVLIVLMLGLLARYKGTRKEIFAITSLLIFTFGLKFYTGALISIVVLVVFAFSEKPEAALIWLGFILAAVAVVLYNPLTSVRPESIFSFTPFALSDRMIEHSEYFYLPTLARAKYVLTQQGWGPRLLAIHLFGLGLFVLFEFGVRLVGLVDMLRKKPSVFDIGLYVAIFMGVLASTMLVQRGQWWNVMQFLYVSLFLMSYFAARALARLWVHAKPIVILILLALVPFNVGAWYSFINPYVGASYIQAEELAALEYFKKLPGRTFLYLPSLTLPPSIRPLSTITDSPYVPALSAKQSFVQSEEILKILDVNYEDRLAQVKRGEIPPVDYIYAYGPMQRFCRYDMNIRTKARVLYTNGPVYIYAAR